MRPVTVVIFHRAPAAEDPPLARLLAEARGLLVQHQATLFGRAGAGRILVVPGASPEAAPPLRARTGSAARPTSWGRALSDLVATERIAGLIVLGSGAVARLRLPDARRLVDVAATAARRSLTNNRYSSDVCAVSDATALRDLPPLPGDNALPRWLHEAAGFEVEELPGRDRLAFDLDSPLDLAVLASSGAAVPRRLRDLARASDLAVPRIEAIRAVAADPRRELLVFGRSSSRTLAWLERHVRCRVRFLAEERGFRAGTPLAFGVGAATTPPPVSPEAQSEPARRRPPRATLGRLLEGGGPEALARIVGELADAALIDSRVLLADRLGADEGGWPVAEDRFASDLLRSGAIADPWLRALTASAAAAPIPILLGGHTLVGPGVLLLLR